MYTRQCHHDMHAVNKLDAHFGSVLCVHVRTAAVQAQGIDRNTLSYKSAIVTI